MYNCISSFKKNIPIIWIGVFLIFLEVGCTSKAKSSIPFFSKKGYIILPNDSTAPSDIRWAEYLYTHLKKRATEKNIIQNQRSFIDYDRILVEVDPELGADYKISKENNQIKITATDNQAMLWLIYQFMKKLSINDPRINTDDLPPAIIELENTKASFDFKYRAIYSPTNLQTDYAGVAGTNNIENDWGIWGHNLNKVIGKDAPLEVYALINNERNKSQYCFSSEKLYTKIESFIIENFGEKVHHSFLIAPNDNSLVCQCQSCKKNGNTVSQATAAITKFIIKLAKRFPKHSFFTTSYLSTSEAPTIALPTNVGVIISAINLPLTSLKDNSSPKIDFLNAIKKWRSVTSNIYVWDYINNFDDYLTPFPVLNMMKERFVFFKENGVTGVFLNGSGYEYSSFDDLRTFVLSALMIDSNLSVEDLSRAFLQANYPNSQKLITDYYLSLEKKAIQNKNRLHFYGGISDALNSYLDHNEFINFYNNLSRNIEQLKGEERKNVHKLLIALSFTRLEIARFRGYNENGCYINESGRTYLAPSLKECISLLSNAEDFKDMKYYNEAETPVASYLDDWKKYILDPADTSNLLRGIKLIPVNRAIEEEMNVAGLTDGVKGLPSNYHFGWNICTLPLIEFYIPTNTITKAKHIEIGFLQNKKHNILAPKQVEIWIDEKIVQKLNVNKSDDDENGAYEKWSVFAPLTFKLGQQIKLKITPTKAGQSQTAIDEISLIP